MEIVPRKLVCIFAHPDDESLGPGGTIAYFAQSAEIHLICVTNGDADSKFTHGKISGKALGKIRRVELQNAAEILGIRSVTFLDFKDGELSNNNYHDVSNKVKKVLDEIKPDSLMTLYIDGVSGHLDHVAVSMETSYLFEKLKYVKNLFYYVQNRKIKKLMGSRYFIYFPIGFSENEVDWVSDVSEVYKTKIKAMQAHKSQLKDFFLIKTLFGKLIKKEYFKILTK